MFLLAPVGPSRDFEVVMQDVSLWTSMLGYSNNDHIVCCSFCPCLKLNEGALCQMWILSFLGEGNVKMEKICDFINLLDVKLAVLNFSRLKEKS